MNSVSTPTRQKTWQTSRRRVSVLAEMALRKERIAERLADLRGMKGYSQEQAAAFVGITVRQWQRWEAGESVPYPRNLDQIASRFGISVAEFFEEPAAPSLDGPGQLDRIEALLMRLAADQQIHELAQKALGESLTVLASEVAALRDAAPAKRRRAS